MVIMTYKKLYRSFQEFIDQDTHFTENQQDQILESFKGERNKKIFRLSIILLLSSVVGISIDSFIIGGSVIGIFTQGLSWVYVLPTIIFSIINFILKAIFIHWYLKKEISWSQICLAGIPYVGSASVIAHLVRSDPLYGSGLQHYLRYLRKKWIPNIFPSKNKTSH
jgi:uncharacterized membrane-anchored protein YitT (DUF2179 family)